MSSTVQVCCNGASADGHKDVLRLEYSPGSSKRNVRLGLPRFVTELLHIPPRTLDLLELAAYVYAADRYTSRGSRGAVEFHSWSRRFCIRMKVRDVTFWNREEVQQALRECLTFMTGDADFSFVFSAGHKTPPTNLFDQEGFSVPTTDAIHRVALFSGGLDSLSGAVQMLKDSDASLVLVSHHSQPTSKQVQRQLANALNGRFPGRASLYGFECTLKGIRAVEETQRSRSFLYCSIGYALARAYQKDALTIYENGVTSMNLARREDLMNARASRTTHPRTLDNMQSVLSLVADEQFEIVQPAFWLTKRDVVERIVSAGHGDLIASSVSCSRTFQREGAATQCGRCFQCIDRRLAVFSAGHEALDDASLYTVDIARNNLPDEESRTTAIDYLRQAANFAEITDDRFFADHLSELADAFDALPMTGSDIERAERVWQLMKRHGESVRGGLIRIRESLRRSACPVAERQPSRRGLNARILAAASHPPRRGDFGDSCCSDRHDVQTRQTQRRERSERQDCVPDRFAPRADKRASDGVDLRAHE